MSSDRESFVDTVGRNYAITSFLLVQFILVRDNGCESIV